MGWMGCILGGQFYILPSSFFSPYNLVLGSPCSHLLLYIYMHEIMIPLLFTSIRSYNYGL